MDAVIFMPLIDSDISNDKFVPVNDVLNNVITWNKQSKFRSVLININENKTEFITISHYCR